MKTTFRAAFGSLAFAAALIATPAAAADLYGRRPGPAYAAAPFSGYNWNGVYVGANLGYQWGKVTNWGPSAEPSGAPDGPPANGFWGPPGPAPTMAPLWHPCPAMRWPTWPSWLACS